MEILTYSSIFDYFSATTGIRESVLREKLRTEGIDSVSNLLRRCGKEMFSVNTVLAEDLTDSKGKIKILDSSRPLYRHISLLLGLHKADDNFATSPIVLEIKDTAIIGSRQYMTKRVTDVIIEAAQKHPVFGGYASALIRKDKRFEGLISASFQKMFASTAGVRDGMRIFQDLHNSQLLLENTAAMAVLCGSAALNMQNSVTVLRSDSAPMQRFMCASLLFYLFLKHGKGHLSLCQNDEDMKRILDISGNTSLQKITNDNSVVRSIVTAHIFIKLLERGGMAPAETQVHTQIQYLADEGYADEVSVSRLREIFLGERRFKGMEIARRLSKVCKSKTLIWGADGSPCSVRILCANGNCEYARGGRMCISKDITVKADREYPTAVSAGEYHQCLKFVNQFEDFFRYTEAKVS
ncbi:hypothetical protein [Seleniivibrio woodruffii]|uniref:hypothetical protein n=1 Tax=Seleniivibrio woodruffii TaxID=1078050 RepID=UPI0026ECE6BC|nr:hypothetical protein [Seleniivibrio woodruffii]